MVTVMTELTLKIENLVTFTEASRRLGVSRSTVYNMVVRYKLHPVAIGRNRYLLSNEVELLKVRLQNKKAKPKRLDKV